MRKTFEQLRQMKESEHKVEFKKGEGGNIAYNGGNHKEPKERRKCILGRLATNKLRNRKTKNCHYGMNIGLFSVSQIYNIC